MNVSPETLARWRADAAMRGGVPAPSDRDPHARYLANRLVAVIDMVTGILKVEQDQQIEESGDYHDGAIYGIRHPGPRNGCPYCAETIAQAERWSGPVV